MKNKQKLAILLITKSIRKIDELKTEPAYGAKHVSWLQTTHFNLCEALGQENPIATNFFNISYQFRGQIISRESVANQELARAKKEAYLRGLDEAKGVLSSAIELIEYYGIEKVKDQVSKLSDQRPNVFISHGRKEAILTKVADYVRAFGLNPLIVKKEPSKGMGLDDLVDEYLGISDCAIILATCDDKVGDYFQPRPNVLHEIGKAQEIVNNRLIYLLEEGCNFSSNVHPKVWESFTEQDLSPAFQKIAKELKAFGLIIPRHSDE